MPHSCDSPPLATEPRQRPGRPSVVLRLGVWIAAIASLAMVSILASITVAELSSGEARAINLAGSLRMQSYLIDAVVSSRDHAGNLQAVEQAFTEFEARYRDPELKSAIPRHAGDPVRTAYDDVGAWWSGRFRPAAARAISSPPNSISLRTDTAEMVTRIDRLVALVEQGLEAKLQWLRLVQGISLVLLLIVGAGAVFQLKVHVIKPLADLLDSAHRVRHGDFGVSVPTREADELGQLGEAFNFMVEDLSRNYAQLEQRVLEKTEELACSNRSLNLLYSTTRRLSERAVTHATLVHTLQDVEQTIGIRSGALCLGRSDQLAILGDQIQAAQIERLCCSGCLGCDSDNGRLRTLPQVDASLPRAVAVPLFDGSRSHGAMLLEQADGAELAPWQVELLETIGHHIGTALAASRRNEESHRLALLDERSVIARELHDSLAQALSYLKIQVARLQKLLGPQQPEPVNEVVGELRDGLSEAYRQLRELLTTFRLRIDGRGLNAAIDDTVQEFRRRSGLAISLDNQLAGPELDPGREIHVLQIIREALSNIERHARATQVRVSLANDGPEHIRVQVEDDGVGFELHSPPVHRYGLVIMRDRAESLAGEIQISPRASGGTRVELRFPTLPPAQPARLEGKQ
ncbi:MAG: histidine kinase [Zoogloea sp.]|nr:histidine kinase [Zoogloea sp.]